MSPALRYFVLTKDGFNGTFGHASIAIDTRFRVDIEHLLAFPKTIAGAHDHAIGVLATMTRLSDDIGHIRSSPLWESAQ
jgi:hypothetical protein